MENHIFRSAIGGFNRQDVLEYIERVQKQSEETVQRLEAEADELRRELSEVRSELDECTRERDDLSQQLEDMTASRDQARDNWDAQSQAKEAFRRDLSERDATIQEMTGEKQRLQRRVEEMESQMGDLRRQKEQLAQMELEARQRAGDAVSAAEAKAGDIIAQSQTRAEEIQLKAKAQAETVIAESEERSASINRETQKLLGEAAAQYDGFLRSFQEAVGSVVSEIQKLDAAVRLPEGFARVTERLAALRGQTEEPEEYNDQGEAETAGTDEKDAEPDGEPVPSERAANVNGAGGPAAHHRRSRHRRG